MFVEYNFDFCCFIKCICHTFITEKLIIHSQCSSIKTIRVKFAQIYT